MNRKRVVVVVAVVLAVAAVATAVRLASKKGNGGLTLSGNVEATEVSLAFRVPGRLAERLVDEGQRVQAGQLVARLEADDLTQMVAQREADLQTAQAVLAEFEAGSRPEEIAQGKAALDGARAELEKQRAEYDRQKVLLEREVISQREFDAVNAAFESARAREKDAAERLVLLKKGPRKEQVEAARARALQAQKGLELAKIQLGYAELRSPVTGVVLSKAAEPGEVLPAGAPVITAADLSSVWVRAYVEETDLGRVKLGQEASVTVDAFPGRSFPGRVAFISSEAEFTPRAVQTKGERVKLVYRVKVDVANPDQDLKPGMPADVSIEASGTR